MCATTPSRLPVVWETPPVRFLFRRDVARSGSAPHSCQDSNRSVSSGLFRFQFHRSVSNLENTTVVQLGTKQNNKRYRPRRIVQCFGIRIDSVPGVRSGSPVCSASPVCFGLVSTHRPTLNSRTLCDATNKLANLNLVLPGTAGGLVEGLLEDGVTLHYITLPCGRPPRGRRARG